MTCEQLLELDLDDPQLAEHIAHCASCAAAVRAIRAQQSTLHEALRTLSGDVAPQRTVRHRWRAATAVIPLAAAAVLALLLTRDAEPPIVLPEPHIPGSTIVNAVPGSGVAVMQTKDPNITVVWTF